MLKLHFSPNSIAMAVLMTLEEIGAEYALVPVDFAQAQQRTPDFLKLNPLGRVPVLETAHGLLTETPAILTYLAHTHPESGLLPDDAFAAAQVHSLNAFISSTLHVAHAHRMRGHRWVDDEAAQHAMRSKVPETVGAAFRIIEDSWPIAPFVHGAQMTMSDPYLATVAAWMEVDGVDPAAFPKVSAHRAMMEARPAIQRALAHRA